MNFLSQPMTIAQASAIAWGLVALVSWGLVGYMIIVEIRDRRRRRRLWEGLGRIYCQWMKQLADAIGGNIQRSEGEKKSGEK